MISVEEALERILAQFKVLEEEERPLLEALGQVLSRDIISGVNVPQLTNSAMDGYAVTAEDTRGANKTTPRVLSVLDVVPAGAVSKFTVTPGTALRIMTGAPIPEGADAVVQFEDTDELERKDVKSGGKIGILREVRKMLNIREAGEDVIRGQVVLKKGAVIGAADAGVIASVGKGKAWVVRRPVIAILATGDELAEVGEPLKPGKIFNSNTYSVAALTLKYGAIPKVLGIARDNVKSLTEKIRQARDADLLLTSGGVSAGDYDMVKNVLAKEGEIGFWTVRMKPGKPLAFGMIKGSDKKGEPKLIPHLGLPGNPVSSMVTFEIFVRSAIYKMMGKKVLPKPTIDAVVEEPVANTDGRRFYARVIVRKQGDKYFARLTGNQGSGVLTSMSLANGLIIVPEDRKQLNTGETAKVMMLDWNEEQA